MDNKMIDNLLSYGFKEYPINSYDTHDRNFQYCLKTDRGKKLFVQVRLWQFSKYSKPDNIVEDSFDAYCQYDMRRDKTFNVSLTTYDMSPDEIVKWFDNVFEKLGCSYYEEYNV